MSLLYAKSRTWRWVVARSKESPLFFSSFAVACVAGACAAAAAVQSLTNPLQSDEALQKQREMLTSRGRRADAAVLASVNKQRLSEMLSEVQAGADINDRYRAALRGQTLVGPPNARRNAAGSSIHHTGPATNDTGSASSASS